MRALQLAHPCASSLHQSPGLYTLQLFGDLTQWLVMDQKMHFMNWMCCYSEGPLLKLYQ